MEKLKRYDLNCNIFDVYDYDGLSMQELLCQFYTKINECVDFSNSTLDLCSWLVNEGLKEEVAGKLTEWLNNGELDDVIINGLIDIDSKIEEIKKQLTLKESIKNTYSYQTLEKLHDNKETKILCIGDSLTYGSTHDGGKVTPYTQHLQAWLNELNVSNNTYVINEGLMGYRVDQYEEIINDKIEQHKPNMVIMMFGANESIQNSSKQQFRLSYENIIKTLINENIEVVCMTTHRITKGNSIQSIQTFNEIVRGLCIKYNCVLFDWYEEFDKFIKNEIINIDEVLIDGVHLSSEFYYKLISDGLITKIFRKQVIELTDGEIFLVDNDCIKIDCPYITNSGKYKYSYNINAGNFVRFSVYNNTNKNFYLVVNKSNDSGSINIFINGMMIQTLDLQYPQASINEKHYIELLPGLNYIQLEKSNIVKNGHVVISGFGCDDLKSSLLNTQSNWTPIGGFDLPKIFRNNNYVYMKGFVTGVNGSKDNGTIIAKLDNNFIPSYTVNLKATSEGGSCDIEINTNGEVKIHNMSNGNWILLNTLSYAL